MTTTTYSELVRPFAKERADKDILNSSFEHAELGVRLLLENAGQAVKILSTRFYGEFWKALVNDIEKYLERNVDASISVIVRYQDDAGFSLLKALRMHYGDRVKVSVIDACAFKKLFGDTKDMPNFLVAEPVGYRFELSDKDMQDSIVKGIINFGDKKTTDELGRIFDFMKSECTVREFIPVG